MMSDAASRQARWLEGVRSRSSGDRVPGALPILQPQAEGRDVSASIRAVSVAYRAASS